MAFDNMRMEHHILKEAREGLGLMQQQVADKAKIRLRQYQRYESGEHNLSYSPFEIARRVLNVLELDLFTYALGGYDLPDKIAGVPQSFEEYIAQTQDGDIPLSDIFNDKICVFIGKLERCSRQAAQDRLFDVGGVPQDSLAVFVSYVIVGKGAETTKLYKEAKRLESQGFVTFLTEQEFFDALDGKFVPPANPNKGKSNAIHIPATNPAPDPWPDILDQKRAAYIASKKILVPGGYMKVDLRPTLAIKNQLKEHNE
jgi:transcriptional regulator with XRE-family HTH domain